MATKYCITLDEYNTIKEAIKRNQNKRIDKKLQVIKLKYEGMTCKSIGEKLDYSKDRVAQLCKQFKLEGLEEFIRCKHTSHKRVMSETEEKEILDIFVEKANAGHVVTANDIRSEFEKKLGRKTDASYFYRLLKRHGWRKVMPRSQHPKKASEAEIEASKKLRPNTWNCVYSIRPKTSD